MREKVRKVIVAQREMSEREYHALADEGDRLYAAYAAQEAVEIVAGAAARLASTLAKARGNLVQQSKQPVAPAATASPGLLARAGRLLKQQKAANVHQAIAAVVASATPAQRQQLAEAAARAELSNVKGELQSVRRQLRDVAERLARQLRGQAGR